MGNTKNILRICATAILLITAATGIVGCRQEPEETADVSQHSSSRIEPVKRAGKPGPRMMLGTSVMSDEQNQIVKSLGFTLLQSGGSAENISVSENQWDWSLSDKHLATCRKAGLKCQYFAVFHWAPEWYRNSKEFVPSVGLRSSRELACMSLWSPDILRWFEYGYAALAEHYGRKIDAIYVGVHGDYGETLFPMGWYPRKNLGDKGVGLYDYWCGDAYACADFRRFVRDKYGNINKLNAAWGSQFDFFESVGYPQAAYIKAFDYNRSTEQSRAWLDSVGFDITSTAQKRRYWLDFVQWHYDSMTNFAGEVCRIARKYFPETILMLPLGGPKEVLEYGQDSTALVKAASKSTVQIRSTHGRHWPFPENYSTMLRRIATACKYYDVPFWTEPPDQVSPEDEVGRFMESISSGTWAFWDHGGNPLRAADTFREYSAFLTLEKPVVDVCLFFPTTQHRLQPHIEYPQRLKSFGAELRDVIDYDIVDEQLIEDGALERYRVLVWVEGSFIEAKVLSRIASWVRDGGVLVKFGADAIQTVEGDTLLSRQLLGTTAKTSLITLKAQNRISVKHTSFLRHVAAYEDRMADIAATRLDERAVVLGTAANHPAAWAMPRGKGWVIVWAGFAGTKQSQQTFYELVRDAVYNLSGLDATKSNAEEVDTDWDDVYATLLSNGEVMLHNFATEPRTKVVTGTKITLPPKSLRSVLISR